MRSHVQIQLNVPGPLSLQYLWGADVGPGLITLDSNAGCNGAGGVVLVYPSLSSSPSQNVIRLAWIQATIPGPPPPVVGGTELL